MNVSRLRHLIQVLKNVPKYKFDIRSWKEEKPACGTVACAAGWAAMDATFNLQGLISGLNGTPVYLRSDFTYDLGFAALRSFFDIGVSEVELLFDGGAYPHPNDQVTPNDVIVRIYDLLAENAKEEEEEDYPF